MNRLILKLALLIAFTLTQVSLYAQPSPIHKFQIINADRTLTFASAAFSYDGTKLAAGTASTAEGTIWDARSGQIIAELQIPSDDMGERELQELKELQFSLDGSLIVGIGTSLVPIAVVWNAETGEIVQKITFPVAPNETFPFISVDSAAITPDNSQVLIHNDGELSLWNIQTGKQIQTFPNLAGHFPLRFFPDGQRIAVRHREKGLVIMNWQTGEILQEFTQLPEVAVSGTPSAELSPDLKSVFITRYIKHNPEMTDWIKEVIVWDTDTGEVVNQFPTDDISGIRFSPNRTLFINLVRNQDGGFTGNLTMRRVLPSKALERISTFSPPAPDLRFGSPNQIKFSPDGEYFFVFSGENGFLYRVSDFLSGVLNAEVLGN